MLPYELLVGWRYLRRSKRSRKTVHAALAIFTAATGLGGVFFAASVALREIGILLLVFGSIGLVASALLQVFSAFTTVSILGVALGVRTLAVVLSVTGGFEREFKVKVLGVNAHVIVMKYGVDFAEYEDVIGKARAQKGVTGAAPFVLHEMMISRGSEQTGILVKGIDPARVGSVLDAPRHLRSGSFAALRAGGDIGALPGVLLGLGLAERLHASVGDVVQLVALGGDFASPGLAIAEAPRSFDLRVAGLFHSGFEEYDRRLVYIDLAQSQKLVARGDVVTGVELKLSDIYASGKIARAMEKALGDGPYRVIDWKELNHNLFSALRTQKVVLALVMTLIVLVAAFNIVAALALLVVRKTREIAILKSMGLGPGGVARIFQSAGLVIGLIGAGLGVLWAIADCALVERYGYPLDPKVYLIGRLPVDPDPVELALTAGLALAICLLATVYPARRAVELRPVEGLRYE
ncbi:MAG: ABC transporter permease [Myxococcota bacterium]|mgnify:CR=1 FL=1